MGSAFSKPRRSTLPCSPFAPPKRVIAGQSPTSNCETQSSRTFFLYSFSSSEALVSAEHKPRTQHGPRTIERSLSRRSSLPSQNSSAVRAVPGQCLVLMALPSILSASVRLFPSRATPPLISRAHSFAVASPSLDAAFSTPLRTRRRPN